MSAVGARHIAAAVAMKLAKEALEGHEGPWEGPEYKKKISDWHLAVLEHGRAGLYAADEEMKRLEREEADAALQADRCDPAR